MKQLGILGLMPEVEIQKRIEEQARTIFNLNLAREKRTLLITKPDLAADIDVIERELKRYFLLILLVPDPDFPLAPANSVDLLWHELILNTPKYVPFCDSVYGHYLHHIPEDSLSKKRLAYAGQPSFYTKDLMTKHFGSLDINVWGISARCDSLGNCMHG